MSQWFEYWYLLDRKRSQLPLPILSMKFMKSQGWNLYSPEGSSGKSLSGESLSRWVSVQGESLSKGVCLSRGSVSWGSLSRGVSVQGVSVQGFSVLGVSVKGGLCPVSREGLFSGGLGHTPYGNERMVRILLECILVVEVADDRWPNILGKGI